MSSRVRRWRCRHPRRVAGEHCCSPAPSERHVNLSVYAAQASLKAPRGTRWGAAPHLHDTGPGLTSGIRRRPHQQQGCRHLLCLPSQLFRRSRAETPEGSQPAFAGGDLARRLNPYPSDYRSGIRFLPPPLPAVPSATALRRAYPEGRTTGLPRSTDVSSDGLGSACSPVAPTATAGEGGYPCTWPRTFWFKPISAFGLLVLTTFISSSPELAMPSTLAPDRLDAGSRRVPSRETRPPGSGEDTLSQELRTAGLLRPHVLVGYRWSHTGLCPGVSQS